MAKKKIKDQEIIEDTITETIIDAPEDLLIAPEPIAQPKQFLLLVDEMHMSLIGKLMPGLLFVEVQGKAIEKMDDCLFLINPKAPDVKEEQKTQE